MLRFARVLLLSVAALSVIPAGASAVSSNKDATYLAALWTTVFQTPSAQNPFGTGGPASACLDIGHTLAPFGPNGVASCTVRPGMRVFVAASSFECSTFEANGTTYEQLVSCARQSDAQVAPAVTVDGTAEAVSEVVTGPLTLVLPANNIFGLPAGSTGLSAAHGWVVLLHPLAPGTHTIVIQSGTSTITTTIVVEPHR